ncbi:DUF2290 domain-containing protein [Pedobacter cryotolerans]|uniref:DUF2290 domain-containing protein n=1 Tax=Pedobacter cryotolerans TaxID=2571270 RepID=A0A4U1C2P1_9SPHI|nr:DUF2290 domain-containing protein [Pedobacter cryotolerans]TKC00031.1 DUF2290 domain-containing protein [Pedobacter cryotolerans]
MNQSLFNISLQESKQVLRDFSLFKNNGLKSINNDGVTEEFKLSSQKATYKETFLVALRNFDYDIILNDQSFFQFQMKKNGNDLELRYAFFQTPFTFRSYQDFVSELLVNENNKETLEEIGELFHFEYQQYLDEQELLENYSTIRYDFEGKGYRPLIHSTSHLHIGYQNHMRIPLNKTLTPLKFVLFVIKQVYYREWKEKANSDLDYIKDKLTRARINCTDLKAIQWNSNEQLDLHIL